MPGFQSDLYSRLGVSKDANAEEIKKAYRKMSVLFHPDKVRQDGGDEAAIEEATRHFTELQQGYETLSDPKKRAEYDSGANGERKTDSLIVPPGLERPSAHWKKTREALTEVFISEGLTPITSEQQQKMINKNNPANSPHFTKSYYQNLYCLTQTNAEGEDLDDYYADVFALIKEKAMRSHSAFDLPEFLTKRITPETALETLQGFLKGKYYGEALVKIQGHLRTICSDTEQSIPNKALYTAILNFISIRNLQLEYRQAQDAIHDLYDAVYLHYESVQRQIHFVEEVQQREETDQKKLFSDFMLAKEDLKTKKQSKQAVIIESERLTQLRDLLVQNTQAIKDKMQLAGNTREQESLTENKLQQLDAELDDVNSQRVHCVDALSQAQEELGSIEISIKTAEEDVSRITQSLKLLKARIEVLMQHQAELKGQLINPVFLQLIDSKYFKINLAMILEHYWSDPNPQVTPETLARMTAKVPAPRENQKIKYNPFGTVLQYADQRLVSLGNESMSVQQYYDLADYLMDLHATFPAIGLQALIAAGLSYQLVSKQSDKPNEQMAAETVALLIYQLALQLAAKLPPSFTLYATIQVTRYLSEFRFDQTTLTVNDHKKLIANRHDYNDKIPATKYEILGVHNGSVFESIEGAVDRTYYLLTSFPTYMNPSHFLDQLPRQRCHLAIMEGLIQQFSNKLTQVDQKALLESTGELAEQLYYRYENALTSKTVSQEILAQYRIEAMHALLQQSNTSLFELSQLMNAPTISIPQDDKGYWMPGALLYPDDPESLGIIIYKSFDGYYLEPQTGQVRLMLTRWMPGDNPSDRLFTHDDLVALIKGGVGRAVFSLDSNSVYRKYDPLQVVRFSPQALEGTEYARGLFATDYIMKMLSQGQQIGGEIPYDTRPIDPLLEGLDDSVKRQILVLAETAPEESKPSQTTRFWIQMGEIPRAETEKGYGVFVNYGNPAVEIKKQLMEISPSGELVDAVINVDDQSREAQFARAFTQHYNAVGEILPVFRQLKEFYKISGAINELQIRRAVNQVEMKQAQAQLDDPAHWIKVAIDKKKEWTDNLNNPTYWDVRLNEKRDNLRRIIKNEAHWERMIAKQVKKLEVLRDSLTQEKGREYQELRKSFLNKHQTLLQEIYQDQSKLTWTVTHPDFIKHLEAKRQDVLSHMRTDNPNMPEAALSDFFDMVINGKKAFPTTAEAFLHSMKTSMKDELTEAFGSFREGMGIKSHQTACQAFMQGDLSKIVIMQTEYELAKQMAADEISPELHQFWESTRTNLLAEMKQELEKRVREDVPQIGLNTPGNPIIRLTKAVYVMTDPDFLTFYHSLRADHRQDLINEIKPGIANWAQFEAQYLAQIESMLDQKFSQQSQLTRFNQIATESRAAKQLEFAADYALKNPLLLEQYKGDKTRYEADVEALINGNSAPLAQALTTVLIQSTQSLLKNKQAHETPRAQKLWRQLFDQELILQTKKMQERYKALTALPNEQQQCPDFTHLMSYFAEEAYRNAIDAFMQGNIQPLADGKTAQDIEQVKKELSLDLVPQAKILIDAERSNLEKNIETIVQEFVNRLKLSLTQNMDAQVAGYVEELKESLIDDIQTGEQLESTMLSLELGPMEKEGGQPNTKYRVPAIFTHQDNRYVYGGVCARPGYRAVEMKIHDASQALLSSTCFSGNHNIRCNSDIADAKQLINKIGFTTNLSLRMKVSQLEQDIRFAEMAQFTMSQQQRFGQKSTYQSPLGFFQQGVQQHTFMNLAKAPETPQSSLFNWRMAGVAAGHLAKVTLNNTLRNIQADFSGMVQGLGDLGDMLSNPMEAFIMPMGHLIADSLIIGAAHHPGFSYIGSMCAHEGFAEFSQVCQVIKANRSLYDNAVESMKARGNNLLDGLEHFAAASEAEQHQMSSRLLTNFVAPSAVLKAGTFLKSTIRLAPLAEQPLLFQNTYLFDPPPPAFPPHSVGAAQAWTIKGRILERGLPNEGRIRFVPPEGYVPQLPLPRGKNHGYIDKFGNEWIKGASRKWLEHGPQAATDTFEWDVQLSREGLSHFTKFENDLGQQFIRHVPSGAYVNVSPFGHITH